MAGSSWGCAGMCSTMNTTRLYFPTAMLQDGRIFAIGGEFGQDSGQQVARRGGVRPAHIGDSPHERRWRQAGVARIHDCVGMNHWRQEREESCRA